MFKTVIVCNFYSRTLHSPRPYFEQKALQLTEPINEINFQPHCNSKFTSLEPLFTLQSFLEQSRIHSDCQADHRLLASWPLAYWNANPK